MYRRTGMQAGIGGILRGGGFSGSILICGGERFAGAALKAAREFHLTRGIVLRPEATVVGSISKVPRAPDFEGQPVGTLNGLRTTAGLGLRYEGKALALTLNARCVLNGGGGFDLLSLAGGANDTEPPPPTVRLRRLHGEFSAGVAKSFADGSCASASLSLVHTKLGFSVALGKKF
jgi:hypothetical protein